MSTALAIAATTRVLTALITDNVTGVFGAAQTTSLPPDLVETGGQEPTNLNLFLYHVTYNQGWREVGLPSRNDAWDRIDRPPLAVDLHYLLTAYGADGMEQQMLLGLGMQALHENPVLSRQQITQTFVGLTGADDKWLVNAGLDQQIELIKVTPEPLSTEDLSKLWTAFGGKFRSGSGYEATVVLIESTARVQAALPVRFRTVTTLPITPPEIDGVAVPLNPQQRQVDQVDPPFVEWAATPPTLILTGTNLTGEGVVVAFDGNPGLPQVPTPIGPGGAKVSVAVPPLQAGINTLRVVRQVDLAALVQDESPIIIPDPTQLFVGESNTVAFFLQPVIATDPNPPHNSWIVPGPLTPPPANSLAPPSYPLTVHVAGPVLGSSQKVQVLLNEWAPAVDPPPSYTFDATEILPDQATFSVFGVLPNTTYLVRLRVDGAESALLPDQVLGEFTGPWVRFV